MRVTSTAGAYYPDNEGALGVRAKEYSAPKEDHMVNLASNLVHTAGARAGRGRGMRLLLLAPPGAGKGTQGERLAARLGVQHISAGDLLRAQARADTPVGREIAAPQARGDLVPDQIVFDVLTPVVVAAVERGSRGPRPPLDKSIIFANYS
jgi:Adenylate kinase